MAATKFAPCTCSSFEFGQFEPNTDTDYDTSCDLKTRRVFAQGHDAKLVGFLVRAELAGDEIRRNNGGVIHSFQGAVHAASSVSEALALKAQLQLDAAHARNTKKAAREAAKAAKKSRTAVEALVAEVAVEAPAPTTREAKIKVGRWTYNATINLATGRAVWTSKLGKINETDQGSYTEV
jgi:hypothetical protein